MRRRSVLIFLLLLLTAAPALAGGGPQNVLVVYNPQFPQSQAIALHYQAARHIPADNMLSLSLSLNTLKANTYYPLTSSGPNSDDDTGLMMTITEFTTSVYTPIVNYLAAKGLSNQVYILVLCEGVPWRMWPFAPETANLNSYPRFLPYFDNTELGSEAWVDTALARFTLSNLPPANLASISDSNSPLYPGYTSYYSTNDAFRPATWTVPTYTSTSGYGQVNAPIPFLVSMLYGYFAGDWSNGQNLVNDAIDLSVSGDAAFPQSTFLFLKNDDYGSGLRSCRSTYYWIEAETMRQKGFGALVDYVTGANLPTYQPWTETGFKGSVMGVTMGQQEINEPGVSGTTAYVWSAAHGWPWAKGAYAETLTSFGGYFLSDYQAGRGQSGWWHTTPECFLAGGASAGFGTGKEPGLVYYSHYHWDFTELMAQFPLPLQFRRYADGFSYVEVMYQSLAQIRDATIVGDPLAAPFAKRPSVSVSGLPTVVYQGSTISASATAAPFQNGTNNGKSVQRLDAYLDGHYLASYVPTCPAGNTVSVTISGHSVSYTTTGGETRADIFTKLKNAINANFSSSLAATTADLAWYDNIDTADLAQPPYNGDPQGNPTSGQLMLLTQLRGSAGNGFSCTASLTAPAGGNFARPSWLAPATYGGTQWANPMLFTKNRSTGAYTWPEPTTGADNLEVQVALNGSNRRANNNETLTVLFQSSDLVTSGSGLVTISDTAVLNDPNGLNAAAAQIAQEMADISHGQYGVDSTGSGVQAVGRTPASTFIIYHPTTSASPFTVSLTPSPLPLISPDANGTTFAQTSNGGPGLNYLYLDLGPDTLSHTFTINTTTLAFGPHELQIVGVDGGAAEAQGYAYVNFQYEPNTLTVATPSGGGVVVTPSQASYTPGTPVQIVATAAFGYTFAGWFVNSGTLVNYLASTTTLDVAGGCVLTASFTADTLSVTATASAAWVYQNTPLTTKDRHAVALTLSVTDTWGNHSYSVTVSQDGAAGVVTPTASWTSGTLVTPTGSATVAWSVSAAADLSAWLVGGRRQADGYDGTGPCTITIRLAGDVTPADQAASLQFVLIVRPLGDITDDGAVTTADRVLLRKHFNGLPTPGQTAEDFRLDGDGSVTTADLNILNTVLDNFSVP